MTLHNHVLPQAALEMQEVQGAKAIDLVACCPKLSRPGATPSVLPSNARGHLGPCERLRAIKRKPLQAWLAGNEPRGPLQSIAPQSRVVDRWRLALWLRATANSASPRHCPRNRNLVHVLRALPL